MDNMAKTILTEYNKFLKQYESEPVELIINWKSWNLLQEDPEREGILVVVGGEVPQFMGVEITINPNVLDGMALFIGVH